MRPVKFDLPLNDTRIATLEQLEDNLTPEIFEPFRSGRLAKWLRARSLDEKAGAVEGLLAEDVQDEVQLFIKLCEVFEREVDEDDAREMIEEYAKDKAAREKKEKNGDEETKDSYGISDEKIRELVRRNKSFILNINDMSEAVKKVEEIIEKAGMSCRIYTEYRMATIATAAIPVSPMVIGGVLAAISIGIHNLATYDPDYEIAKNPVKKTLTVTYKKQPSQGTYTFD